MIWSLLSLTLSLLPLSGDRISWSLGSCQHSLSLPIGLSWVLSLLQYLSFSPTFPPASFSLLGISRLLHDASLAIPIFFVASSF